MALSLSSVTIHLRGVTAADVTTLEIDGDPVTITHDRSWTWSASVPAGTRTVTMTALAPSRREVRVVALEGTSVPAAAG